MLLNDEASDLEPGFCAKIPPAFSSLEEARNSLDFHWNTCIHLLSDMTLSEQPCQDLDLPQTSGPRVLERRLKFSIAVKEWVAAYNAFLQKNGKFLDKKGLQAARSLEITQIFCAIYLEVVPSGLGHHGERLWDKFTARYEHIVKLASLVVHPYNGDCIAQKHQPEFSLDLNIVAPLYAVAHRCRDPVIRRKAVSILYAAPRQEGVWDGVLTARVAEKLISIEERGLGVVTCAGDVPDHARIESVNVKFDLSGRLGMVVYHPLKMDSRELRETVTETISW